jgi:hypothetical protein
MVLSVGRAVFGNRPHDRQGVFTVERPDAGSQFVQHNAERPDVRALVDCVAGDVLGRHVRGGSDGRAGPREAGLVFQLGDPEIKELDRPGVSKMARRRARVGSCFTARSRARTRTEENVRGLDVAMDDARIVGGGDRTSELYDDVECFG